MPDEATPIAQADRALIRFWHRVRAGEDPVAFGAVVVVLALLAGLVWFWAGTRNGAVPAASATPRSGPQAAPETPSPPTSGTTVAVHVAGAVAKPGLYELPSGARILDALRAAGGHLPRADLDRLNLAAKVFDGQKILVARRGEAAAPAANATAPVEGTPNAAEPIDLNTADLAALDSLPGIGPGMAQAILEERTRRGGFQSVRDLLRVPGIGEGRFARLKDRVRV